MYIAGRQELACIGSSWSDERFLFPGRVAYTSPEEPILTHKHAIISEKTSFTILVESRLPGLGFKAFFAAQGSWRFHEVAIGKPGCIPQFDEYLRCFLLSREDGRMSKRLFHALTSTSDMSVGRIGTDKVPGPHVVTVLH